MQRANRPAWLLSLYGGFLVAGLILYSPALDGSFISDDEHYVLNNAYAHDLTIENVTTILDPTSVLVVLVENYAPVHVLLHAFEWQLFGPEVRGYHIVNVFVHALASLLLVVLLRRSGVGTVAASMGGAFFLVHPANVEAVAWISQLKTSSALVLCLAAVLAHPRRPAAGAVLFVLSLLAKPTAAVALFAAAAFGWARLRPPEAAPTVARPSAELQSWKWKWLAGWALALALFAVAEFAAFGQTAGQAPPLYAELSTRLRSIFAISLRYLVMAASSFGLSAFHEPEPADSFLDPWWLASLPVLALLGWRVVFALRRRREEAVYWLWALISFAPICGLIPLPFPMADRYLYFMLPGLVGGVLLAAPDLLARITDAYPATRRSLPQLLKVVAALWIVLLAGRSFERAHVWISPGVLMADVERNYPSGTAAKTNRATRAALAGDAVTAVALLEQAHARGYNRLDHLLLPSYARIQNDPDFDRLKKQWAREWIERLSASGDPSQQELQVIAQGHVVLGDLEAARRYVERAIDRGGPITENLREDLAELDRVILRRSR
jgi:hypothetical protein